MKILIQYPFTDEQIASLKELQQCGGHVQARRLGLEDRGAWAGQQRLERRQRQWR